MSSFVEGIFNLLVTNITYPYYQAERRIDIFINFFIEDIIQQKTPFNDAKYLVPEFPLKKSENSDHSAHIDYLMFSQTSSTILLIELKTDDGSYLDDQIDFYLKHFTFGNLYSQFESIKMKAYITKKNALIKKLECITNQNYKDFSIAIIVLKPTITETDERKKKLYEKNLHFISLNDLKITTYFQKEWDLFRNNVLSNLLKKTK